MNSEYQTTIEYLYGQLPMFQSLGAGAYKPGVQTTRLIDNAFGAPHSRFRAIHVAGTNGKGSVSHTIASALMVAGYKVGLYTSPHLVDFRERIRINGEKISEQEVVDFVKQYHSKGLDIYPTFFELTTIMAFDHFACHGVDYAVIEVGLGGRLDSTNIITPVMSVITNVSLDHVALLGDTLTQIAGEKAGIIKPGVPVVIGETTLATREVYQRKADAEKAPIIYAEDVAVDHQWRDGAYCYSLVKGAPIDIVSDLMGSCQPLNANTALAALRYLFDNVIDGELPCGQTAEWAIKEGMSNVQERTGLMGRWMKLRDNPLVICDTGHNIGAWTYLADRLTGIAEERMLRVVLGFANDKDVEAIFALLPENARYYFVAPDVKRARAADDLLALAQRNGLQGASCGRVTDGYKKALADSSQGDMVFVGGSNFVVAEIL